MDVGVTKHLKDMIEITQREAWQQAPALYKRVGEAHGLWSNGR